MNKNQVAAIALEIGQIATGISAAITAIPAIQAATWVPITLGICSIVATVAKQIYGNTPQNVPGSTAADIAAGAAAPPTVPIAPPPPVAPVVVHPIPTPPPAP
jgi:hypothetical protein